MKKWFMNLSQVGKAGLVGAALFGLLLTGVAASQPAKSTTACAGSQQEVAEKVAVPFEKTQVSDNNLEKGRTTVSTTGVNGEKTITKQVTSYKPEGCQEPTTKILKEELTVRPVTEVTAIGTKEPSPTYSYTAPASPPSSTCHPSYNPCVPNVAYDLDCGDIRARVTVHGVDTYHFDADGDGVGCERY